MAVQDKPTILIIDSQVDWQKRVTNLLDDAFNVIIAGNYEAAVEFIISQPSQFHVVVTEISLNEGDEENIDGFRVIDFVISTGWNIQTIILTRYADTAKVRLAFKEKKVFDFLEKVPERGSGFNESEFLMKIREAAEIANKNVFLVMPFAVEYKGFQDQISDIVESIGMICRRADDVFQPNVVMESVLEEIKRSRLVVADISDQNLNVHFEIGIAHAIQRNVILLTKNENETSRILSLIRYIVYNDSLSGGIKLKKELSKAIQDIRYKTSPPLSVIKNKPEQDLCMLLVSEDEESQDTYEQIIKPVLDYRKLKPIQLKEIFDARDFLYAIRERLHSSCFLIADVHKKDPNIFYLAGYAYGLGKNVIYLAQNEEIIPFDLRISSSIIYSKHMRSTVEKANKDLDGVVNNILSAVNISKADSVVKVFLNYAAEDLLLAKKLYSELKNIPWIDPWMAEQKILPGQDWEYEIDEAMKVADSILICVSSISVKKIGYVQTEILKAEAMQRLRPRGNIFMIPVLLEPCNVPATLQKYQWVEANKIDLISKSLEILRDQKNGN